MDKKIAIAAVAVIAVVVIAAVVISFNKEGDKVVITFDGNGGTFDGNGTLSSGSTTVGDMVPVRQGYASSHGTLRETVPEMHTPPGCSGQPRDTVRPVGAAP